MIKGTVETAQAQAKLGKLQPRIIARFQKMFERFLLKMESHVKTRKLSGQVLHRRSGTLSRSIHHDQKIIPGAVVGRVYAGKEAPYAAVHEFGGTITVPQHTRTQTMAWGRPMKPKEVLVRTHQAKYPMRSFLRTTLAEFRKPFLTLVRKAVTAKA